MVCPFPRRMCVPFLFLVLAALAGGCPEKNDGDVSAFVATLTDTTPTDCDTEPIANAGADLEADDPDGDGFAYVYLNATESTPAENIVVYAWTDNGKTLAAGDYILVRLSVGTHPLMLRIEDACGREATDTISVEVKAVSKPAEPGTLPQ